MNTTFRTRSLSLSFGQAFLFEEGTNAYRESHTHGFSPIVDLTGKRFVPLKRLHGTLPEHLHMHLQHLSALVNYELSFGWPTPEHTPTHMPSWQDLHDLGVIALVDATMQRMLRVLHHYAAITQRPFFDFSKVKAHYSRCQYTVTTAHGKQLTVSDALLTILTTPQALTFFRRTTDVSKDELALIHYVLSYDEPVLLHGSPIAIVTRPLFLRYIHVKERIEEAGEVWKEHMNAILYF